MDAEPLRRRVVHDLLPALGIMLAAWLLMSLMQGMPTLCALARPCPAEDVRVAPALTFGALMLIPVAVLVVRAVLGRPRGDSLLIACYAVLVVFALAGPVTVLFSGGFGFPVPWL